MNAPQITTLVHGAAQRRTVVTPFLGKGDGGKAS